MVSESGLESGFGWEDCRVSALGDAAGVGVLESRAENWAINERTFCDAPVVSSQRIGRGSSHNSGLCSAYHLVRSPLAEQQRLRTHTSDDFLQPRRRRQEFGSVAEMQHTSVPTHCGAAVSPSCLDSHKYVTLGGPAPSR